MPAKKNGRGGPRKGSGRKPTHGEVRTHRVVVLLTGAEHKALLKLAKEHGVAAGTVAYEIVSRSLRRRKK